MKRVVKEMITRTDHGEVTQFVMGKEIDGKILFSMAVYYVDGILIDTGPCNVAEEAKDVFDGISVEKVVNTHHHEDHIGNNTYFNAKGVPVFAHELAVPLINEPSRWVSRMLHYQKLIWGIPPASICHPIGDSIESDKYGFKIIHTPGHSHDHICLLEDKEGWLFTGDLFLKEKVKLMRSDEDLHSGMMSLQKLLDYEFDTIFCSSGRIFDNAKQRVIAKLNWWQDIYQQVIQMTARGYDAIVIRDKLLGEENSIVQDTEGDVSKLNLIRSALSVPAR